MKHWTQIVRLVSLSSLVLALLLGAIPPADLRAAPLAEPPPPLDSSVVQWAQSVEGDERTVLISWREEPRAAHQIYLPLVMRSVPDQSAAVSNPPASSAATLAAVGANTSTLGSTIYRHASVEPATAGAARSPSILIGYTVYRRAAGETEWQALATTGPAADADEMVSILGTELAEQLAWDLADEGATEPLTMEELYDILMSGKPHVRLLAEQYYQVGLVLGLAHLDRPAPLGQDLEYYVSKGDGTDPLYAPVKVRDAAEPGSPTGLTEVWPGPVELGRSGSGQPSNAEERYRWDHYQQYRSWDGTVYLIWDVPEGEPRFDGPILDDYKGTNIAGYHVYRKPPLLGKWQLVNPIKDNCAMRGSKYCVLQIRPGAIDPRPSSAIEEPYFFKESLKEKYTNPSSIYTSWSYRVCAVDLLGNEACSSPTIAYGRDLHPPAMVKEVQVDEPDGGPIELSWIYSDTDEINLPLRLYVTRSPTMSLPLENWEPVTPTGGSDPYILVPVTSTLSLSITDSPPEGIPHWYRVQVRDDAGNWSPVSSPALGALYPRTPPPFPEIPYDDQDCSANEMPLRLTGLDPRVSVIAVYRSFAPDGPWQLVDKVIVTGGAAEIIDDYLPPYPRDMYYRLEAWDGHGNVSETHDYCTHPNPGTVPPPPTGVNVNAGCDGDVCDADITWTDNSTVTKLLVMQGGVLGPETSSTETPNDSFTLDFNAGALISVTLASQNENGTGEGSTVWIQETNNYLDTDRQMTDLGPIFDIEWVTQTVPSPVARIDLTGWCDPVACDPKPLVSIFRRIPSGNWMQVSTVQRVSQAPLNIHAPWIISDTSTLMPFQTYEYVVLAHSPTSYEVLGFWQPKVLEPLEDPPPPVEFFGRLDPNPDWPAHCEGKSYSPADLSMPAVVNLHNGWTLDVAKYTLYDPPGAPDPTCPPTTADADHLSGLGDLSNGSQTWTNVTFFDIAVNAGTGDHLSGRIVTTLGTTISGDPTRFDAAFGQIEFSGVWSKVEVVLTLPDNLSVRGPGGTHFSNRIFGHFGNVGTDLTGSGFSGDNLTLADENLPWLFEFGDSYIRYDKLMLNESSFALTDFRLGYPAPRIEHPAVPDNNLGFLRPEYSTTDIYANRDGLHGSFSTSGPFSYSTSFPAAVIVSASVGAAVNVAGSTIQDGTLYGATARLDYFDRGKVTDYMVRDAYCGDAPRKLGLCQGYLGPDVPGDSYRTLMLSPLGGDISIGLEGKMLPGVSLDQTVVWPSFEVLHNDATLFIASAAFSDTPTSWGPMPAENAWHQLIDPGSGADYDPGLNLNFKAGDAYYACFDPGTLEKVAMDLYVRRGGVSEYLLFENGPSRWHNSRGYQEKIERMELIFVDNLPASIEDYRTLLDLPYPSDVTLPLTVEAVDPATNCALSGDIDPLGQVTHQYWRFEHSPTDWYYTDELDKYEGVLGHQRELLVLQGKAIFTGLNPQTTTAPGVPVTKAVVSEWLPNGDIGDLNLDDEPLPVAGYRVSGIHYSLSDVMLSSFYSEPMNEKSLPDTLGFEQRANLVDLPAELLIHGDLTPDSLKKCAAETRVGCGFIVLDGEGAVQFFGALEPNSPQTASIMAGGGLPFAPPTGSLPILNNQVVSATISLVLQGPKVHWVWPVLNDALDFPIPLRFLGNTEGGALAMVLKDARLFPAPLPSMLHTDLGLAITFDWNASDGFFDEIGIQLGYAASQAAFRALAMNRPLTKTIGTQPYLQWTDVEADITEWAQKFGYSIQPGQEDDPVDLARRVWESWGTKPFTETFDILEPVLDARNGSEAYGVTGIEPKLHDVLDWANVDLNTGLAQMVYVQTSLTNGYIEMLRFGGEFQAEFDLGLGYLDPLLGVDWLSLIEYNKDGEFLIHGEDLQISMLGEFYPFADFDLLVGTAEGNKRVEGGIDFDELEIPSLFSLDLGGVFGSGQYDYEEIFFIGVTLDTGWTMETDQGSAMPDLEIGVSVIAGTLPNDSPIIRGYGFGDVLDKFNSESIEGAPPTFSGFYSAIYIDEWHPVYSGCLLDVGAGGELRVWYFVTSADQELWGGQLSAHIYAEVACLVSARGQLALTLEQILGGSQTSPPPGETHGWGLWDRTCPGNPSTDTCLSFSGTFWAAAGIGWCEPGSWNSWSSRWWGDSWCYTFGAIAGVSYLEHASTPWDWDYDLDYE